MIPKVNRFYWVNDAVLGVGEKKKNRGHNVIVISISDKKKTAVVKTITSLEHYNYKTKKLNYDFAALDDAKAGNIIPIPKKDLNSRFYSGFHGDKKVVKFKDILPSLQKLRLPKQYLKAIKNK